MLKKEQCTVAVYDCSYYVFFHQRPTSSRFLQKICYKLREKVTNNEKGCLSSAYESEHIINYCPVGHYYSINNEHGTGRNLPGSATFHNENFKLDHQIMSDSDFMSLKKEVYEFHPILLNEEETYHFNEFDFNSALCQNDENFGNFISETRQQSRLISLEKPENKFLL